MRVKEESSNKGGGGARQKGHALSRGDREVEAAYADVERRERAARVRREGEAALEE